MTGMTAGSRKKQEAWARISWRLAAVLSWLLAFPALALLFGKRGMMESLGQDFFSILVFAALALAVPLLIYNSIPRKMGREGLGKHPELPNLVRIQFVEWGVLCFALLPTILNFFPAFRPLVMPMEDPPDWVSQNVLLLLGALFQLSAVYFLELIWLHGWLKRRIMAGSARGDGWMADFKLYAGKEGDSIPPTPLPARVESV